jgi:hypothetical protein
VSSAARRSLGETNQKRRHRVAQYEYKRLASILSGKKVLAQIQHLEKQGWELYLLQQQQIFMFGCGGTSGLLAIMRRERNSTPGS